MNSATSAIRIPEWRYGLPDDPEHRRVEDDLRAGKRRGCALKRAVELEQATCPT